MSKRLLSVILAICLVFTAFSPAAMAVEAGEDAVVNASQTAEESTETGKDPKDNSNVIKGEKTQINSLKNGGTTQTGTSGTGTDTGITATGGRWDFEETDASSQVSLLNTEKRAALEELKLAAEVYEADEKVVAFVVMEDEPLVIGCDSIQKVSASAEKALLQKQDAVISAIEKQILGGETLKVRYQFTYLTNSFTVETAFGDLEKIVRLPGVKSVFLAPVYEACDASTLTVSSGQMVGVPSVWTDLGYTGKGMKIAIIDTGLDLDHPSFAADPQPGKTSLTEADVAKVMTELNAYAVCDNVSADLLYRSAKVPFAFNYDDGNLTANHDFDGQGDHGTHVAGIAAANAVEGIDVVGMAPDAQIIVMKVFGNTNTGAAADNIVAALEDAMTLGCDVANMSLGSANGFSSVNAEIDLIYERLASQDIVLTASAGNEGTSSYDNMWGTDLNLASNPENSTVSQPSTYANAMSIASAENAIIKSAYFTVGEQGVFYQDSYEYLMGMTTINLKDLADQPLEYVIVPGLGGQDSYYDMETGEQITDVAGKVAVVMRGEISFVEKCYNAEMMGAAAVVIWNNNDEDDIYTSAYITSDEAMGYAPYIPVGIVTYADGLMMSQAEEKLLTVSSTPGDRAAIGAGEMSSFSSWGTTSDLRLLPDITGIGGNVFSCYDGGQYGVMSGTSMSAPQVAGITALVMEYLHTKLPSASDGEIRELAEALLMSTADVITDSSTGLPYSPRQQGAGLVDADGALLTDSYLTVGGAKPKAELGDSENGVWKFSFEIHNFGDETLTYDLSGITTAPAAAAASEELIFMLESSVELGAEMTFSKASVTLAPGEKTNVTVTLKLASDDKAYIDTYFANGAYVEGFVYLTCEGGQDLNLPFMGFYGDWTDAPLFDTAFWYQNGFWGVAPVNGIADGSQYYHTMWTSYYGDSWVLGMNPYSGPVADENGNIIYDAANNAISPNGDGAIDGIDEMYLSLLRNAKEMTITYSVGDEILYEDSFSNLTKTMYQSGYGQIVPWLHSWYGAPWDFAGVADGTTVDVTIQGYIDYGTGGKNTITFPVTVDLTGPALTGAAEGTTEDGTNYLVLQLEEAIAPAAVFIQNPTGTQIHLTAYDYHMTEVAEGVYQVMLPIGQWGTELLVTLCDYAGNESNYMLTYTAAGENKPEMDTSALYGYQIQDMEIGTDEMFGWTTIDKETGVDTMLNTDMYEYYALTAAEYVDGYVFAIDAGYNLIAMVPGLWNRMELCNIGVNVLDMSWDKVTNTMYLLTKEDYDIYLKTLDLMTGETTLVAEFGYYYNGPIAMTFDDAGTLYVIKHNTANLFTYNPETQALDVVTDADGAEIVLTLSDGTKCKTSQYSQSMTHSAEDNAIYWAYTYGNAYYGQSAIVTIDMETMTSSGTKDEYMHEFVGLLMLEEDEDFTLPYGGELQSLFLSSEALVLSPGGQSQLSVSALPWDYDTSAAQWSSSDEAVVTVEDGVIAAVGTGSATVTATLGGMSADCEVTVLDVSGDVYGYNYFSDDGSYGNFFHLDMETGSYALLGASPYDFVAGDYNGHDGYFYGYTENGQFHRVNMDTLEGESLGSPVAAIPYDMAYDYATGTMYAMVFDSMMGDTAIYAVDLGTGAMINPSDSQYGNYVPGFGMGLAIGPDSTIYVLGMYGDLYAGQFVYDDWEEATVLQTQPILDALPGEEYVGLLQSMCYDYANDVIVWANADYSQMYWISVDAENPYAVALGNPLGAMFEFVGLFTVPAEIPELPYVATGSISAPDMVLGLGQTASPSVSILPVNATNKAYTLTSSDETIVKVVNGKLEAVATGSATITVTLADGENTLTCEFQASVLELADYVYGYLMVDLATYNGYSWIRIHTDDTSDPDYLDGSMYDIMGAEKVGDTIYAYGFDGSDWSGNWKFFTMDGEHHTMETITDMGEGFPYVYDMAYDYSNGTMYVLAGYTETNIDLYVADLETGALTRMINLDGAWLAVAAGEGKVWLMQESITKIFYDEEGYETERVTYPAKLYEASTSTLEITEVMDTGVYQNAFGSMTYDSETGYIYWAPMAQGDTGYDSGLYAIDTQLKETYRLGTIGASGAQMSGLYVVPEQYPAITNTDITALLLSSTKEVVTIGETVELSTQVLPTPQVAQITWSSSNEKVATVDENGVVTTHSYGAAIITATATKDGVTVSAQCQVTALNETDTFLTYNNTDMGWAALNRSDLSLTNLTEGEEVGVATFAERKSRIYGYDALGNLFYLARETYERTNLGAVNANEVIGQYLVMMGVLTEEELADADLSEYRLDIRDMEYDKANDRMLVLAAVQMLNDSGRFEEVTDGNAIYQVDLKTGGLTKLVQLDKFNNRAMTVDGQGNVYVLCCFDDQVNLVDMETGSFESVVNLYSQSFYGSTDLVHTLYYDDLADMLYIMLCQNDRNYYMVEADPDSGEFTKQGDVGELWREGWYNYGHMVNGLAFLEEEYDVQWAGNSLSTSGTITVNFYVALSDEVLADENARMVFNVDGKTQTVSLEEATETTYNGQTVYGFKCNVAAKNMADTIAARMYGTEGALGLSYGYSVAKYYDVVTETWTREEKPELYGLVESMLNYGAASQLYFDHNTDTLANAKVPAAEAAEIDASPYASVVTGKEETLEYVGASLVLEANTTLRLFFRAHGDISGLTFAVDGKEVTPVLRGNLYYIELTDIAAKNLDDVHTFTAGGITVEYSALSYVYNVLVKADSMNAELVEVCKALYLYNQAANAYYEN